MRKVHAADGRYTLELDATELKAICNCINEVAHGLHLDAWAIPTRVGVEKAELERLLAALSAVLDG
ncbi:MAG: hypothetical protein AB2A00_00360 [Myxococcota bacterium]